MEGMGLKFTTVIGRHLYYAIQACLGLWLALLRLIASPHSPNRWFSLPPTSHLPHPLPPAYPL